MAITWFRYWDIGTGLLRIPRSELEPKILRIATPAIARVLLAKAAEFQRLNRDNYGVPDHKPQWVVKIGNKKTAEMYDCMDFSDVGILDVKTKEKLAVGKPRQLFRGTFQKQSDGTWRVSEATFVVGGKC